MQKFSALISHIRNCVYLGPNEPLSASLALARGRESGRKSDSNTALLEGVVDWAFLLEPDGNLACLMSGAVW